MEMSVVSGQWSVVNTIPCHLLPVNYQLSTVNCQPSTVKCHLSTVTYETNCENP